MKVRRVSFTAAAAIAYLTASAWSSQPGMDQELTVDEALEASADALEDAADVAAAGDASVSASDLEPEGMWKPVTYYTPLIDEFLAEARPIAEGSAALRQAVAAKYGLSPKALDETITFLLELEKQSYDSNDNAALRSRALRLPEVGNRAPISVMFAAGAIGHLAASGECSSADIELLMKGSRDPDADLWAIASSCAGSEAFAVAIERTTSAKPALLYLMMNWTRTDAASDLAATDMLLRPDFLALVDADKRSQVHADIARYKLAKLLGTGLPNEALAFGDSLDPSILAAALGTDKVDIHTRIGGVALKTAPYGDAPASDYAAALALANRQAEARSVLDLVAPMERRQQASACLDAAKSDCAVGDSDSQVPLAALLVDHFLDRPNADPYMLVEGQSSISSSGLGGAGLLFCELGLQPGEQQECDRARETAAGSRAEKEDDGPSRTLWAAIRRVGGQPFEMARAGYAAKLAALGPVEQKEKRDWSRASIDPVPVPFREFPLPADAGALEPKASDAPESFAPLPDGHSSVRFERQGPRAAAISLSQRFDPNGEVSAGGYWLHLSDDGGKSWQAPLYTGLAEHFPYIVPAKARLPLLARDRIRLEVEEALIDTASISYPPVGMGLKRKRSGIYLDIPIAELRKDSDGDGLSDIAARHLLLDQPRMGKTPFVVGQERDCSAPPPDTLARLEILKKIFQVEARANIESAAPRSEPIGPWRKSLPTDKPPIFLAGNPDEYRCVVLDRPMIVYSEADRERLRRHSPDFQLIELPPIRWNRDRTRGFVNWNMGWVGGTFRLVRDGQSWKLESISEWIS